MTKERKKKEEKETRDERSGFVNFSLHYVTPRQDAGTRRIKGEKEKGRKGDWEKKRKK